MITNPILATSRLKTRLVSGGRPPATHVIELCHIECFWAHDKPVPITCCSIVAERDDYVQTIAAVVLSCCGGFLARVRMIHHALEDGRIRLHLPLFEKAVLRLMYCTKTLYTVYANLWWKGTHRKHRERYVAVCRGLGENRYPHYR